VFGSLGQRRVSAWYGRARGGQVPAVTSTAGRRLRAGRRERELRWRTPDYDRYVRLAEAPLLLLSLLLIPVLILPEVNNLSGGQRRTLDVVDYAIWAAFVADYLNRLRLAADRRAFVRGNLLDLALVAVPMLRPLRLARAGRLVRFALILARSDRRAQASLQSRAVAYVGTLALTLTIASSVSILEFERQAPGANIRSYGDALWWAATTVSTVGYGDRYPVTVGGRLTALVLIAVGVSMFGVITASVAAYFVRRVTSDAEPGGEDLPARLDRLEAALARVEAALAMSQPSAPTAVALGQAPRTNEGEGRGPLHKLSPPGLVPGSGSPGECDRTGVLDPGPALPFHA